MAVPQFLTVIEASRVLRIGRTVAYAETRRFRETDGREGIPCVEIGGQVRVPTAELERLAGCPIDETSIAAPVTPTDSAAVAGTTATEPTIGTTTTRPTRQTRTNRRTSQAPTLPFAS